MSNTFNAYAPVTTSIEVKNIPVVASAFKAAMLSYRYASNCEWYTTLTNAKSVKDIFDIINLKFVMKDNKVVPVIKDIPVHPDYKTVLESIAPYMNDGDLIVNDDYHIYTLKFRAGKITGTRRKIGENIATTTPQATAPAPVNTAPKKSVKSINKATNKAKTTTSKKYGKTEVRSNTDVATVQIRPDNRYTIQEISKELIRQILNGNGGEYIEVKGDCLFKSITKTA